MGNLGKRMTAARASVKGKEKLITYSTSGISNPRAATSVAINNGILLDLNDSTALFLSF